MAKRAAPRHAFGLVRILLLVGLMQLMASCGLIELFLPQRLFIEMPVLQATSGMRDLYWYLIWRDANDMVRESLVTDSGIEVQVVRGARQAIIAYPMYRGVRLFPAGGLYPYEIESRGLHIDSTGATVLRLCFDSGYVALVSMCLEKVGKNPWIFPLQRLHTIWEKSGMDPWNVVPEKVAAELAGGGFGSSLFTGVATTKVRVVLPCDESWFSEDPYIELKDDGGKINAYLGIGIHYFYGGERRIAVCVDTDEKVSFLSSGIPENPDHFSG
jgi:hypothetical protein